MNRQLAHLGAAATMLALAACTTPRTVQPPPATPAPSPPPIEAPPPPSDEVIVRHEPKSRQGNPAFYEVAGKRYFVLKSAEGYVERGVASWYGPGFHRRTTSNGERYDMYAMTAAHKTLPLPSYVRVTNLKNGRSLILRVNDRGPFKDTRIIDVSYAAAARLDMLKEGTAFVEVRALMPDGPRTGAATPDGEMFVQAGAFTDESNATKLVSRLQAEGLKTASVRKDETEGRTLYRVRVGPVPTVQDFDRIAARLRRLGIHDARLAAD